MIRGIKNFLHGYEARLANLLHGKPSRKIFAIGITGTDGKTTTASLIHHILKEDGKKVAMITSVGAQIGEHNFDTGFHTTTPSSFTLQKYIRKAVDVGCDYLVLEVTSHALDQGRVKGIDFKIGVLTNITHEHLDYHESYKRYVQAKMRLFKLAEMAVLNMDDESFEIIAKHLNATKIISYSLKNNLANFSPAAIGIKLPEQFDFNKENFLAAIAVCKILGIEEKRIQLSLMNFKFPEGRQEIIYDKDFKLIIDFAHTPNAFERVLPEIKKATKGRLIHVFGAAGERDKSKRPLMGTISSKYSDIIILTAEDPRSEKVDDINKQIKIGVKGSFSYADPDLYTDTNGKNVCFGIQDRFAAIKFAINLAKKDDTIIVTGKGHEKSMNLGDGEIPWNDKDVVLGILDKTKTTP